MSISVVVSLSGFLLGAIGTTLGVMNFLRDRGKLMVRLQWDMAMTSDDPLDQDKRLACITVTNVGRRAVYMSHVALRLPRGEEISHFLIQGGLKGQKISEGDPPSVFPVEQDGLEAYGGKWQEIVAQVSDSTGKEWVSKKVQTIPSWAKTPNHSLNRTFCGGPRLG